MENIIPISKSEYNKYKDDKDYDINILTVSSGVIVYELFYKKSKIKNFYIIPEMTGDKYPLENIIHQFDSESKPEYNQEKPTMVTVCRMTKDDENIYTKKLQKIYSELDKIIWKHAFKKTTYI